MSTTTISEDELREFQQEAAELLDQAETSLLGMDRGEKFGELYGAIFRVFHP